MTATAVLDISLADVDRAAALVRDVVPPTPTFRWPLLSARLGLDLALKHENHTPLGAFKVRGGLTYVDALRRREPQITRLVSATRGNHGQSIAFAATRAGLRATIVVPEGNSAEKNAAMRALGAELIVHGADFDEARAHAMTLADDPAARFVPSYHRDLIVGVATYARELFAAGQFDVVYVPIGLGSGISAVIRVRDLLGLATEVVGVVSERFPAYARSFEAGRVVEGQPGGETIADGMACRVPDPAAVALIRAGAARIATVSEAAVREAMGWLFADTHNAAEGAGAAAVAAVAAERERLRGARVAAILSGGNVDAAVFSAVLA